VSNSPWNPLIQAVLRLLLKYSQGSNHLQGPEDFPGSKKSRGAENQRQSPTTIVLRLGALSVRHLLYQSSLPMLRSCMLEVRFGVFTLELCKPPTPSLVKILHVGIKAYTVNP